jgi:hypothetical protein
MINSRFAPKDVSSHNVQTTKTGLASATTIGMPSPHARPGLARLGLYEKWLDNPTGSDPICWSAYSFHNETELDTHIEEAHDEAIHNDEQNQYDGDPLLKDFNGVVWDSKLIPDFVAGPVQMEVTCPPPVFPTFTWMLRWKSGKELPC